MRIVILGADEVGSICARDAGMIVAVTRSDEANFVACKLAATMFNIPGRLARIRSGARAC